MRDLDPLPDFLDDLDEATREWLLDQEGNEEDDDIEVTPLPRSR